MNKQWIITKNIELDTRRRSFPEKLMLIWKDFPKGYHYIFPSTVVYIMRIIELSQKCNEPIDPLHVYKLHEALKQSVANIHYQYDVDKDFFEKKCKMDKDQLDRFLVRLLEASAEYTIHLVESEMTYNHLLDSPAVSMEGDLIITDPYYFLTSPISQKNGSFVLQSPTITLLGCNFEKTTSYGFGHYDHTQQMIFENYTVPASRICVGTLEDILKIAPQYDDHKTKPYRSICVKDFKGTVQLQIREVHLHDDKGNFKQYQAFVVGRGINTSNNEPLNFEMQLPNKKNEDIEKLSD